ncbi:tRNA 2-thiouridine synthesizing protein E [Gammaproteobacteria bacterium]
MIRIQVQMKYTQEPVKRIAVEVILDAGERGTALTNRDGMAVFGDLTPASGKLLIDGAIHHQGLLHEDMTCELLTLTDRSGLAEAGSPDGGSWGSTAYPNMQTRSLWVEGREVLTDSEGYLVNPADWSEAFLRAQAQAENLTLNAEHWELIRYLRDYYVRHAVQAQVREIIRHFREIWGPERGNNRYLHDLFPRGGPQKQGNRLAGLLRTKGEH